MEQARGGRRHEGRLFDLHQGPGKPVGLPEVVNWTALMGWSYDDHTEFFTMPDLVEKFSLERLNPSPAAINFTKLDHFNGLHIRSLHRAEPRLPGHALFEQQATRSIPPAWT